MEPARWFRENSLKERLLLVDGLTLDHWRDSYVEDLSASLNKGDILVVNDAATLPASFQAQSSSGESIEVRLVQQTSDQSWRVVVFGSGSWREATENRKKPPVFRLGERIQFGRNIYSQIISVDAKHPRLIEIKFDLSKNDLWDFIYRRGKPIQYSYLKNDLPLWAVQTVYAARPWAFEMPSAGRPLKWELILKILDKGIKIVSLTHSAGVSSTGDPSLDQALPLKECYEISEITASEINKTKDRGGRVIAVGTSVMRALESSALTHGGKVFAEKTETELMIDETFKRQVVNGLLTGMHESTESHFHLLSSFVSRSVMLKISAIASARGYLTHEFGDSCLILT